MEKNIKKIEEEFNYNFKDKDLLITALTHSSYANEHNVDSYEKLEFLGDAVLNFIVADFLFENYGQLSEGDLSKRRAYIVSEDSIFNSVKDYTFAKNIKVVDGLIVRNRIITDVYESIVGAIFIDSQNYDKVKKIVCNMLQCCLKQDFSKEIITDYKSHLLEKVKSEKKEAHFICKKCSSDNPEVNFQADLYIDEVFICSGYGRTKKRAEQMASNTAVNLLNDNK